MDNSAQHERTVLRDLAKQVAEVAAQPIQREKADRWRRHNDLQRVRPMVLVFPEGSWRELLPDDELQCQSPLGRWLEGNLRRRLYYDRYLPDDNVIEAEVICPVSIQLPPLGLELAKTDVDYLAGAYHIEQSLVTDEDIDRIRVEEPVIDWEATKRRHEEIEDLIGDLLPVVVEGRTRGGICPVDTYSRLRGLDQFFLDLVDQPEFAHRAIDRLTQREMTIMTSLERQGGLSLGNRNHYAGSGGTSYTNELPQTDFDGTHVRTRDLWGFATAQIFSEVSPAMHEEFALQHERKYLELFGLNCYGCCEPLHHKLDAIFRHVPRLRRLSISPWADIETCAEGLQKRCIFSWKPNPADLAADKWQPEQIRADMRAVCERTRDNILEIVMKDTHTVRQEPRRMHEWVQVARDVAEEFA